ncbi:MAG: contractile injection system protein, VgrG/Pvc8 family [Burkholderiaceae bacterium]
MFDFDISIPSLASLLGFAPAQAATMPIPEPVSVLVYQGKNISADIAPYLKQIEYTDALEGESDSLDITLADPERKWSDAWYPDHGDKITASMGYLNAALMPCGEFEVDEVELSGSRGSGDEVVIKALGAGVSSAKRTKQAKAYDATTLKGIAEIIAKKHKLMLKGKIEDIKITRVTQAYETDLAFLKRIAGEYGYAFSMRGKVMSFYKRTELKDAKSVVVITREDVESYRFRDKTNNIVKSATVAYHDPKTKKTHKHTAKGKSGKSSRSSADEHKVHVRAENPQQAKLKAEAAESRHNEDQTSAELSLIGSPVLMAGVAVVLSGFGKYDGKYTINKSRHSIGRGSGYTTNIELKRVRE